MGLHDALMLLRGTLPSLTRTVEGNLKQFSIYQRRLRVLSLEAKGDPESGIIAAEPSC